MNRIYALRTITSLHVGTGQSVGTTDLPITRERATRWPVVPGSSVKGVLKDAAKVAALDGAPRTADGGKEADRRVSHLFGSPDAKEAMAGALTLSDARCILFPVRSFAGTFAYATCPLAITRLNAFIKASGLAELEMLPVKSSEALVASNSALIRGSKLILEDIDLDARVGEADAIANRLEAVLADGISERLAIVSDDVFTYLAETATEVATHVTLEFASKTAKGGMLRSEERVPAEAVFAGFARLEGNLHADSRGQAESYLNGLDEKLLQFGGKSSVGNGLCTFLWWRS